MGDKLERKLSPLHVWALAFGCTIGWAAFIMPGTVFLKEASPLATLFAMEIGAFIMLIIAYSYHFMIRKFPVSGGEFVYAKAAFGEKHGFICAWFLSLCYLCVIPLNATALGLLGRTLFQSSLQFGFHYNMAGFEIYMGEALLAVAALVLFSLIDALGIHVTGRIQMFLAAVLLGGVLVLVLAAALNPGAISGTLRPLFRPETAALSQLVAVAVTAPQAYVGFDVSPQLVEESNFSMDGAKVVMDTCILCSCFVYVALAFLGASALPDGVSDWPHYIDALKNFNGVASVPTLYAAYKLLGNVGVCVWAASAVAAMLTGIIGFYAATSRLLYSMSREGMLPSWFSVLSRNSTPTHATFFCMCIAIITPFLGRTVLGWVFDMASVSGSISFGYTSLAARKYALQEGRKDLAVLGTVGASLSALLAILLLVPIPGLDCSLSLPSYIFLALWFLLGAVFFRHTRRLHAQAG